MNKEQYLKDRQDLYNSAQSLINDGNLEEANIKMEDIKKLDEKFENESKATANLNALNDNVRVSNIANNSVTVTSGTIVDSLNAVTNEADDITASLEYRKAFMNNVLKNEPMPSNFKNANQSTGTGDVGALIPSTVVEKIVEKLEATGMILSRVNRTAIKGGVSIPKSTIKPVASWVAEGATSDTQKKPTSGNISFTYHKLRCAVSVSLETDTMALPVFESTLINNVTEAMVKALEQAIVNGDGTGKPTGVLAETPNSGQLLEIADINYDALIKAEGALPLEHEGSAVYCMTKQTFMDYMGIVDTTGQPIARVTYGLSGKPERTLLGRTVVLCNYLDSFQTATVGKPFAFLFNFADYTLNTNFSMGIKKYEDNATEDQVTKSVMLVDGKVVDKGSLVILKKKAKV